MKHAKFLTILAIFLTVIFVLSAPNLTLAKDKKWRAGGVAAPNFYL